MPTPLNQCRYLEVWDGEQWKLTHMSQLVRGDIFRMFESTGEPVKDNEDNTHFICAGPATVNCSPFKEDLPQKVEGFLK